MDFAARLVSLSGALSVVTWRAGTVTTIVFHSAQRNSYPSPSRDARDSAEINRVLRPLRLNHRGKQQSQ